jgi:hypothetical protein
MEISLRPGHSRTGRVLPQAAPRAEERFARGKTMLGDNLFGKRQDSFSVKRLISYF